MNVGAPSRSGLVVDVGREVKLRVAWWEGERAKAGDGLETPAGRRYLITKVSPSGKTLTCRVLPHRRHAGTEIPGRWFSWWWRPRS